MNEERVFTLTVADQARCRAAMAGMANSSGGRLVLTEECGEIDVHELAQQIDPPLTGLISVAPGNIPSTRFVDIRQSPDCPHIDTQSGRVFAVDGTNEIIAVSSRSVLDRLYQKGRAAELRAQRSTDGMVERIQLASYGHYGVAVIACLSMPSGDPYAWASEHPDELITDADPFMAEWKFLPAAVQMQPGVVEIRGRGDVTGIVRITRAGCVLVGEMRRKLPGDLIGTPEEQRERLSGLLGTLWRIASQAEQPMVITRFLCEGLRGTALIPSDSAPFPAAKADALDVFGPEGLANNRIVQTKTFDEFMRAILALYDAAALQAV